jgi:hypothetical protein
MPQPNVFTDSHVVDPTKGLAKEEPPKPPELQTDALKIPKFNKLKPPPPPSRASKTLENKTPPADNAVPYGKGGQMNVPTGYGTEPGPMSSSAGLSFGGQGGAEFAARYPWYVASVTKRVQDNWMQSTIDPPVRAAFSAMARSKMFDSRNPAAIAPWTIPGCAPCSASTKCQFSPPTGVANPST